MATPPSSCHRTGASLHRWLSLVLWVAATCPATRASIVQRWSFNAPAKAAPIGTKIPNEIPAGLPATVIAPSAAFSGSALKIKGNDAAPAAIELPDAALSGLRSCTIEAWISIESNTSLRQPGTIFQFGETRRFKAFLDPSLPDFKAWPASHFLGYLTVVLNSGIEPYHTFNPVTHEHLTIGSLFHFATSLEYLPGGKSRVRSWINGVPLHEPQELATSLGHIRPIPARLCWFPWDCSIAEFRIHDTALDTPAILASRDAGPNAGLKDSDADGIPDYWENLHPGVLNPEETADASADTDLDGLSNLAEYHLGTNPTLSDSDRDSLQDGLETSVHHTNPIRADSDGDSFPDASEIANNSNPRTPLLALVNRYSFDKPAGSTTTTVIDSVGGENGQIRGEGTTWTGTELSLPGGPRTSAPYVDLPNGLISRHARSNGGSGRVTVEAWLNIRSEGRASVIFNFGSNADVPGRYGVSSRFSPFDIKGCSHPGRAFGVGTSHLHWVYATSSDYGPNDWLLYGFDNVFSNQTLAPSLHLVVTLDEVAAKTQIYVNGSNSFEGILGWGLLDFNELNDVGNWLGRRGASPGFLGVNGYPIDDPDNMNGTFDEFRLYSGIMPPSRIAMNFALGPNAVPVFDSDSDGIADWYELRHTLGLTNSADAASDADGDGLTALQEFQRLSHPNAPDSDGDGLLDSVETNTGKFVSPADTGSNPSVADSDGDGTSDAAEVTAGCDPNRFDTDGDGVPDGIELTQESNPNSPEAAYAPLVHRWSFDTSPGLPPDGTTFPDRVTGHPSFNATVSSALGPSVELPRDLLSGEKVVTLEGWFINNFIPSPTQSTRDVVWPSLVRVRDSTPRGEKYFGLWTALDNWRSPSLARVRAGVGWAPFSSSASIVNQELDRTEWFSTLSHFVQGCPIMEVIKSHRIPAVDLPLVSRGSSNRAR